MQNIDLFKNENLLGMPEEKVEKSIRKIEINPKLEGDNSFKYTRKK